MKIGLLVNPLAGLGGAVALKGSDGAATVSEALARGARPQAVQRATRALAGLAGLPSPPRILTWAGEMGETSARQAGLQVEILGAGAAPSCAEDTRLAARTLHDAGIDLLVFAGGDGTARDIVDALGESVPVLGIPAGCKMHSGVYAVNPEAAGELLLAVLSGELVNLDEGEVRDIDEEAFRRGEVRARYYGSLPVPAENRFLQQVKSGGREVDALAVNEVVAGTLAVIEEADPETTWFMGSGSTVAQLMEALGLPNTLLGVDVVRDGELLEADVGADRLLDYCGQGSCRAVLTVIGGQGHLFGRGNQQFSPAVIRALGKENLLLLATRGKLKALQGRPLLVDTGDPALDRQLTGLIPVITGYEDQVLYRVGLTSEV